MWLVTTWAAGAASTWRCTSAISAIIGLGLGPLLGAQIVEARTSDPAGDALVGGGGLGLAVAFDGHLATGGPQTHGRTLLSSGPGSPGQVGGERACRCSGRRLVLYGVTTEGKRGSAPTRPPGFCGAPGSIPTADRSVGGCGRRLSRRPLRSFSATQRPPPSPSAKEKRSALTRSERR